MPTSYLKPIALPSILVTCLLLNACEQESNKPQALKEEWPNEYEVIFQDAEAMKYSLEKNRLEAEQLREIDVPATPPAAAR